MHHEHQAVTEGALSGPAAKSDKLKNCRKRKYRAGDAVVGDDDPGQ